MPTKNYIKKVLNNFIDRLKMSLDFNLSFWDMSYNDMIYFDNAATSLTPNVVIKKQSDFYKKYKSNVHRGLYKTAEISSLEYDKSRSVMAKFLSVSKDEIVWTSGATDSSNKLVLLFEKSYLSKIKSKYIYKNEIVVSNETHNSELLPIQEFCIRNNLSLKYGIENISDKTIFVSMPLASNVTGQIFDIKSISLLAKQHNALMFCDMSAGVGHIDIDVRDLDIDAGYFSLHKMCGPTGVGVLYINRDFSRNLKPVIFGGGMVWQVDYTKSDYRSDIEVFESGTPNISGVIASTPAILYLQDIGLKNIHKQNKLLLKYCLKKFEDFNNKNNNIIKLYTENNIDNNVGTISFVIDNIHAHDVAQILANHNIAIRSGAHCAMIKMKVCNQNSMSRISFYFYNNKSQIDRLFDVLTTVINTFNKKTK